ncbi:MAG: hypothetical protein HUU04_05625 [Verrucomicrobiae bacterium]|nr:hypothetical protein [Verrucomicrobiae bacterium]
MKNPEVVQRARQAAQQGDGFAALDLLRQTIAAPPSLGEQWAAIAQLCAELYDDDAALSAAARLWRAPMCAPCRFSGTASTPSLRSMCCVS